MDRYVMRKPRVLSPGDRVALVAPASPFDRDRFDAGVREIEKLGLCPVVTDGLFARRGYVAGGAAAVRKGNPEVASAPGANGTGADARGFAAAGKPDPGPSKGAAITAGADCSRGFAASGNPDPGSSIGDAVSAGAD